MLTFRYSTVSQNVWYYSAMKQRRMNPERARKIAQGLVEGKTAKQACLDAGVPKGYAEDRAYVICKRPAVFDALAELGVLVEGHEVGNAAKAVIIHKLADWQNITNREISPFLQMGLHIGKLMGPGSVQPAVTNTNIQVNMNQQLPKAVQDLLGSDMLGVLCRHFGEQVEVIDAAKNGQGQLQDEKGDGRIQAGQAPLRLEAGAGGEVASAGSGDSVERGEKDEDEISSNGA